MAEHLDEPPNKRSKIDSSKYFVSSFCQSFFPNPFILFTSYLLPKDEMECILSLEDHLPNDLMGWGDMNTPAQGPGKTKQHQLNGTGGAGNGDGSDGSNCVPNIPINQMHQHQLHHLMQQQQVSISFYFTSFCLTFVCKVDFILGQS